MMVLMFLFLVAQVFMVNAKDLDPSNDNDWITQNWISPPVAPIFKIYIFNVTNADEFLEGAKPVLKEIGPYTYKQQWKKTNIEWLNDGAEIEFDQEKIYRFEPSLSEGKQTDTIVIPNVPFISAIYTRKTSPPFIQKSLGSILEVLEQEPFLTLSVREAVWGHDNPLLKLGNDILPPEKKFPFKKFGLLVGKNGTSSGRIRAFTALGDRTKVGQITQLNNSPLLPFWNGDRCNQVQGTDGFVFPPNTQKTDKLAVFDRDFCRSISLQFKEEVVDLNGLPGYRFIPDDDVFATDKESPDNSCYCLNEEGCSLPTGIFNMTACQYGSPIMLSWPHFYKADPSLLEAVTGLSPDPEKHELYLDIEPKTGSGLGGSVKSQINIAMEEAEDIKKAKGLRNIIWPMMWFANEILEIDNADYLDRLKQLISKS